MPGGYQREVGMDIFIGYDPGGNGKHGVALLEVGSTDERKLKVYTGKYGFEVVDWIRDNCSMTPMAIGIDTLLTWDLSTSGWRQADLALRERYPVVRSSVASPNSLYGSMSIQGAALALAIRALWPSIVITETHPKVLYHALSNHKHDWRNAATEMTGWLFQEFGILPMDIEDDHQWDAAISAVAAYQGYIGIWEMDLVSLADDFIFPVPETKYFWPETINKRRIVTS
ncbi:MAG: DUF429 domain-containing protein [SAR202 cluster bacterium]|nr:DUF429 domain-containing protein [SAR202 cluster bacterium]